MGISDELPAVVIRMLLVSGPLLLCELGVRGGLHRQWLTGKEWYRLRAVRHLCQ